MNIQVTSKQYGYDTLSEAMNSLKSRGYTHEFSVSPDDDCTICSGSTTKNLMPNSFVIDEVFRFEGPSDPGDEMILFAISSPKHSLKGTFMSAFGSYSDDNTSEVIKMFRERVAKSPKE